MRTLLGWLFNRWTLRAAGLAALAALIWLGGPLVQIAGHAPLEPVRHRQAALALVALAVAARLAARAVRAARANRHLMQALLQPAPAAPHAPEPEPGAEQVARLDERFRDAIELLGRARLGRGAAHGPDRAATKGPDRGAVKRLGRGAVRSLLDALAGRRYVYELPWYLIIGAPGSGKTTALRNAGLRFPLADRVGRAEIAGAGGTRQCDWWFTDQAVLLDTAGRYATQDSDARADQAEWLGFVSLLARHRPRRPIDGVLLTVSVADLLGQDATRRAAHAARLRARLQELQARTGLRMPVYVLVTKTDLLAGFVEFFGDAARPERDQVWGVTFERTEPAAAGPNLRGLGAELDALGRRLDARLLDRLQAEPDAPRRAALYAFPQQWRALHGVLADFLDAALAPSRFEQPPMVRGVYFTSGTQEGTPIDRLVGGLGRALGLRPEAMPPPRPGAGRSFFLARLMTDVVFREAGLAGANLQRERRQALAGWALAIAALAASAAMAAAWAASFAYNRRHVADTAQRVEAIERRLAALPAGGSDLAALAPVLQSVRDLADPQAVPGGGALLAAGLGLDQGSRLDQAARNAYERLLAEAFLPRLAARLAQQLAAAGPANPGASDNPERRYEALKTYLMLHDAARFDPDAVRAFVQADWDASLPDGVTPAQRAALASHLDALLASGRAVLAQPPDARLVQAARAAIARTPPAQRAYERLKRLDVGAGLPAFTIAEAGGPGAALVFERASREPVTRGVAGLYTRAGYHQAFAAASDRVAAQLADEAGWVLGEAGAGTAISAPAARERLAADVRRLYLEDYARTWEAFIGDIRLVRAADLHQALEIARTLGAPADSPLPRLFRAIAREVTLGALPDAERSLVERGADTLRDKGAELRRLLGGAGRAGAGAGAAGTPADSASLPERIVDARFAALRRMAGEAAPGQPGQPAPIDAAVGLMGELHAYLVAARTALDSRMTPPPAEPVVNRIRTESARLAEPVGSLVTGMTTGATRLVFGSAIDVLNGLLRTAVHEPCVRAVQGRYPLASAAAQEATPEDFARVFGAGGLLDDFFTKHLQASVDTSTRPWTFRKAAGAAVDGDARTLEQFHRAEAIRRTFFQGATGPAVRLRLRPLEMDAAITQFLLDVDGQIVRYGHGPQVSTAVQWPGPGGRQQVRVEIAPPAASGASGLAASGPWALLRLFEQVRLQPGGQPERFLATFDIDGRQATFEVITASVHNPFRLRELSEFQCPARF